MIPIADGTHLLDLEYLDRPEYIATCVLETRAGLALVDPGPATTLARLEAALAAWGAPLRDVRFLLLTHIHLDHAGAAGQLAARLPRLRVHVHPLGAPHLADPSRLLDSAERIYGNRMRTLWGAVLPVREDAIHPLAGDETLRLGERPVDVAYTPGHARHHVAFLDRATGLAFTGDATGERLPALGVALPATPPPDISVEEMVASGDRILAWAPERLVVTHFGTVDDPPRYIREHAERLLRWSEQVRVSLDADRSDDERAWAFAAAARRELEAVLPPDRHAAIPDETLYGNWFGLARYWRKAEGATTHSMNA